MFNYSATCNFLACVVKQMGKGGSKTKTQDSQARVQVRHFLQTPAAFTNHVAQSPRKKKKVHEWEKGSLCVLHLTRLESKIENTCF